MSRDPKQSEATKNLRIFDARTALAILTDGVKRCASEGIRTAEVCAALDFLAQRAARKWPFDQFRNAVGGPISEGYEAKDVVR